MYSDDTDEMDRWTGYDEFSVDNFVLLSQKQKNLKAIEVGPSDKSLKEALDRHPNLIKDLTRLHSLDLYPDNMDILEACYKIVRDTPNLDELWIEPVRNGVDLHPEDRSSWDDDCNSPGLITTTLFRDQMPFGSADPIRLRYLALHNVDVRWVSQTYMKVVDFPNLADLEIRACPGADAIFAEMAKPSKQPRKLEHLTFVDAGDDRSHQYLRSALENFLRSISSLKQLWIMFADGNHLPQVDAICNHAPTLLTLIMHSSRLSSSSIFYPSSHMASRYYSTPNLAKLCKDCTNLQQLAIGCPNLTVLDEHWSNDFTEQLVRVDFPIKPFF